MRSRHRVVGYLFLLPAVAFVLLTVVYPLLYNVAQSFFDVGLKEVVQGGAQWVGVANYADQFGRTEFWRALGISVIYSVGTVLVSFLVGLGLALLFRNRFPGRNPMRAAILIAWVLPTVVSANIWRWLLDGSYGLLNAVLRALGLLDSDLFWLGRPQTALLWVTLATAWTFGPLAMILLTAGLHAIPGTLYEAARIDGASGRQQFRHLTWPLLRPVSLTVLLLIFIFTFKTFDTIYLMTGGGPGGATRVLPVYAYQQAFEFSHFDIGSVATTTLLIIPIALSVLYFRALRSEQRA